MTTDRTMLIIVALILVMAAYIGLSPNNAMTHYSGTRPVLAIAPVVLQLIVAIVFAVISAALQPKPKPPEPGRADTPDIKEGKAPVEIFGAVWLNEPFMAGWKQLDPPEPIKQSAK